MEGELTTENLRKAVLYILLSIVVATILSALILSLGGPTSFLSLTLWVC